jgi:hypothetical protein
VWVAGNYGPDICKDGPNKEKLAIANIYHNYQGMRGKLIISFYSEFYDREKYFNWKMAVKQEFNLHLVSKKHRVKYATRKFKDFAQFWW